MITINNIEYSDLLLFSILINLIMYGFLYKQIQSYSTKLFRGFILSVIAAGLAEALAWIIAVPDAEALRPYHFISNMLFFSVNVLPVSLGLRYLDFIIYASPKRSQKRLYLYLIPVAVNIVLVLINVLQNGVLFSVDASNLYHRGIGVYISNGFALAFVIVTIIGFYRNKQMITGRIAHIIIIMTLFPVCGVLLETVLYGLSLTIPAYTLATFISFLLMERNELQKDPLTLLNSRVQMENRLQYKLKSKEPFTVIMIDVDGFKGINDDYGHTIGDQVLKDVSKILLSAANFEDFVCRFGGDEFFIILESTKNIGASFVKRIDQVLAEYSQKHPFAITLSFGIVYVTSDDTYELSELVHCADLRMYKDKLARSHD